MGAGREVSRLFAQRIGLRGPLRHETGWASVDQVYRQLDRDVAGYLRGRASGRVRAAYAYEDGALHTFRIARELGIFRLYDLPTVHWRTLRRLLEEEAHLHPAWAPTMRGLSDSADKLSRKDEEIELADRILVASRFTQRSLESHFGSGLSVSVIPYGAPPPRVAHPFRRRQREPIRLLYAGHLSQAKGIAYLIAALARLDVPWTLTVAGSRADGAPAVLDSFLADPRCFWIGHVPHATLLEEMDRSHVFVFPSVVEGFGLVILEAMSAGLPVITTPNTAGPDIFRDGVEGFIVPIRDPDAIAAGVTRLYHDEDMREAMGLAALQCAAASNWRRYEDGISSLLSGVLAQ